MKRMIMFLMASVFFFVGGMTEGMAKEKMKKATQTSVKYVITTPTSILACPEATINITFYIYGLSENDNYSIGIFYRSSADRKMKLLLTLDKQGKLDRAPDVSKRIMASYYAGSYSGVLTIYNTCTEDTGEYYVMVKGEGLVAFFSDGTMLTVSSEANRV